MKTIVFAYHEMGCVGIQALINAGYQICAVFTHADTAGDRTFYGSVADTAAGYNIPVFTPDDVNLPLWVGRLQAFAAEYLFTFSYRQHLSEAVLATVSVGAFNVHASLLPAYRGRAHLNWVLINGETITGVTLHRITSHPDAGPILAQQRVAISADDNALSLHHKLCGATAQHLPGWLVALKNNQLHEQPQDESKASCPGARKPEDGVINWSLSAEQIHNLVRALTDPWPGAFTYAAGQRFIVWQSRIHHDAHHARPGTVLGVNPLVIACGQNALEIVSGQSADGVYQQGNQLAVTLGLSEQQTLSLANDAGKPGIQRLSVP